MRCVCVCVCVHSLTAPSQSVDELSSMRLLNLVNDNKGEETLAEINRKMQRTVLMITQNIYKNTE